MPRAKTIAGLFLIASLGCGRGQPPPEKDFVGNGVAVAPEVAPVIAPEAVKWRFESVDNIPFHLVPIRVSAKERPEPAADAQRTALARGHSRRA